MQAPILPDNTQPRLLRCIESDSLRGRRGRHRREGFSNDKQPPPARLTVLLNARLERYVPAARVDPAEDALGVGALARVQINELAVDTFRDCCLIAIQAVHPVRLGAAIAVYQLDLLSHPEAEEIRAGKPVVGKDAGHSMEGGPAELCQRTG